MAEHGQITDEGIARLRARIGIPEPHPMPPHYTLPTVDTFRNVAVAYGDDNPLWCDPDYGAKSRWESVIAPPPLVGGDTLVGEDEVTEVAPEHRDLMKGDPLRGVHAFYSASAREWWAPLYPLHRICAPQRARRRARQAERVRRAGPCTSGPPRCSATTTARSSPGSTASWCAPNARRRGRRRSTTRSSSRPYTDEQIAEIEAQYERERAAGRRSRAGGRTSRSATRSGRW